MRPYVQRTKRAVLIRGHRPIRDIGCRLRPALFGSGVHSPSECSIRLLESGSCGPRRAALEYERKRLEVLATDTGKSMERIEGAIVIADLLDNEIAGWLV